QGREERVFAGDLSATGDLARSRLTADAGADRKWRGKPRSIVGIANHFFSCARWIAGINRPRWGAPPVTLGVDRADMAGGIDQEAIQREAARTDEADVVLVDDDVRARPADSADKAKANGVTKSPDQVVESDREIAVVVKETNRGAASERAVQDGVVVDDRIVRVEQEDRASITVEGIATDIEVEHTMRCIRVAHVDGSIVVPDERVLLDQDVADCRTADELV